MLTQNLERAVRSLPITVRFAGFESNTLKLAQAGWDLSMRQQMDFMNGNPCLQLVMRYEASGGGGFYAITRPLELEYGMLREAFHTSKGAYGEMSASARMVSERRYIEIIAQMGLDVMHMGNGARFTMYPMHGETISAWRDSFVPVDPRPQEVTECGFEDFKFFKVAAAPKVKDLIVRPEDVSELLDAVLKAQKPLIDKVKRNEQSRCNLKAMREGFEVRPAHTPILQIMAVS